MRVHTRSPPSDPEVLGPCAGWPGQLLRPSDNSQEVKNPFDLRITRSLDPVVDQEDLVQQEGRQRHRPVVAQPGMPETFVQLEHLLEPPEERLDRPAASPVQRPPELRLVEPPPLRPVLAAPPPPVRLPPDPLPAAVEERLGFFRVSRSRKRSPGSLARRSDTPTRVGDTGKQSSEGVFRVQRRSQTDRSPAWPGIESTDSSADRPPLTGPQHINIRWKAQGLRFPRPEAQVSRNGSSTDGHDRSLVFLSPLAISRPTPLVPEQQRQHASVVPPI